MKNSKGIASILITASISILGFTGCSSAKLPTMKDMSYNTLISLQTKTYDTTATKILYLSTLKSLVTSGTITQDQSDRILTRVIDDMSENASRSNNQISAPNGMITDANGTTYQNGVNKGTGNHILSALIIDRVITQAQANIISQKLGETIKNNENKLNQVTKN